VPKAEILNASGSEAIEKAADIIRKGGLAAFPTETVYGLGCNVGNPLAVARIYEVKARPRIDPIIVHVADRESAARYGVFPESAGRLMSKFWPGPLTLVVPKLDSVPSIVTAGLETVAIRVPAHPAALALIRAVGGGIAAPSANPFGYVSPTDARHVAEQLADKIDLILDGGPCSVGVESTILSLAGDTPCLLRAGGVAVEDLEGTLGKVESNLSTAERPEAPGQLKRHYATRTRLEIAGEASGDEVKPGEKAGLLAFTPPADPGAYAAVEVLSPLGNLREAAANLFRALRHLDSLGLDRIIARPVPETGLGVAIMDRLRRCSVKGRM
jgi:L-threonylcarbamoyladenylate synthase